MLERITQYNDQELSIRVYNDESLYKYRFDLTREILCNIFIFNESQYEDLKVSLIQENNDE
jgi:hypothetical protein